MSEEQTAFQDEYQSYGGVGKRLTAAIIDSLILLVPYLLLVFVFAYAIIPDHAETVPREYHSILQLLNLCFLVVIPIMYFTITVGSSGRTIGKAITGLKVVKQDGEPVDYMTAILRYVLIFIPFLGWALIAISSLLMLVDSKNQMIHDKIFKTVVLAK